MPLYFLGVYPSYSSEYSYLNAFVVSVCGFISAITGGIISDKYEQKGYLRTKAYVCMFCSSMGIPTIILCTKFQNNFNFSIVMLGLEYLFAEGWISPAMTMVVSTISP